MSNGWHKCHLCDCEFFDPSIPGYWAWCPECREAQKAEPAKPDPQIAERPTDK